MSPMVLLRRFYTRKLRLAFSDCCRPTLCSSMIDGGVFLVVSIHGVSASRARSERLSGCLRYRRFPRQSPAVCLVSHPIHCTPELPCYLRNNILCEGQAEP